MPKWCKNNVLVQSRINFFALAGARRHFWALAAVSEAVPEASQGLRRAYVRWTSCIRTAGFDCHRSRMERFFRRGPTSGVTQPETPLAIAGCHVTATFSATSPSTSVVMPTLLHAPRLNSSFRRFVQACFTTLQRAHRMYGNKHKTSPQKPS